MRQLLKKLFGLNKVESKIEQAPAPKVKTLETRFIEALRSLDVEEVVNCLSQGVDVNFSFEERINNSVDGKPYVSEVTHLPLDLVIDRSEAFVKLLRAHGAKTKRELDQEKREKVQALLAQQEEERERARLEKVDAYLKSK